MTTKEYQPLKEFKVVVLTTKELQSVLSACMTIEDAFSVAGLSDKTRDYQSALVPITSAIHKMKASFIGPEIPLEA